MIRPYAEIGLNDDWSYIYSANVLAKTGHVVYNGWAAAIMGWQFYAGALFIKIFGFSFTAVRASVMLMALLITPMTYALLLRFGIRSSNAIAGTLTLVLSPLFLPLATSFMTDVPALLCFLVCLYGCVRAVQASSDRAAVAWIVFAGAANLLGGTVRQIVWLGVLVMVPSTAWYLRRRRGVLVTGAVVWAISLPVIIALVHWANHQPYFVVERTVALETGLRPWYRRVRAVVQAGFTLLLLLTPVLTAIAVRYPSRDARRRRRLLVAVACVAVLVAAVSFARPHGARWMSLVVGNYITARGIDLPLAIGEAPDILSRGVQAWIAFYVFAIASVCALFAWERRDVLLELVRRGKDSATAWLLLPFTAATLTLIFTRYETFDRYYVPVMFVAIVLLLQSFEQRFHRPVSALWMLPMAALTLWGVAVTHDWFVGARARAQALNALVTAGVPRGEVRGGFEYDGWTEIELRGYVNDPRIHVPAGAYKPNPRPASYPRRCADWVYPWTPSIRARYVLSNEPDLCFGRAAFPTVTYATWLPPFQRTFYFLNFTPLPQNDVAHHQGMRVDAQRSLR